MLLAAPHFVLFAEVGLRELADDEQPVGIAIVSKVLMDPALIRRPVARGLREGLQAAL
jgi:hypothetical protein